MSVPEMRQRKSGFKATNQEFGSQNGCILYDPMLLLLRLCNLVESKKKHCVYNFFLCWKHIPDRKKKFEMEYRKPDKRFFALRLFVTCTLCGFLIFYLLRILYTNYPVAENTMVLSVCNNCFLVILPLCTVWSNINVECI